MRLSFLLFLTVFFTACGGVRTTGDSGKIQFIKIFNRPDGGKMYFAGPMNFDQVSGKGHLDVDYTLIDQSEDSVANEFVTVNFTYTDKVNSNCAPDKFVFQYTPELRFEVALHELLFKEKSGKFFRYRYSVKVDRESFYAWVEGSPQLKFEGMTFEPGKKGEKHLQLIKDQIVFAVR